MNLKSMSQKHYEMENSNISLKNQIIKEKEDKEQLFRQHKILDQNLSNLQVQFHELELKNENLKAKVNAMQEENKHLDVNLKSMEEKLKKIDKVIHSFRRERRKCFQPSLIVRNFFQGGSALH
jgi:predicted nuclease with TOPRIM domain